MTRRGILLSSVWFVVIGCTPVQPGTTSTSVGVAPTAVPPIVDERRPPPLIADTSVGPSAGSTLTVAEPVARRVLPAADTPVGEVGEHLGIVRGVMVQVQTIESGATERVATFVLSADDGRVWMFAVQGNAGITGAHAREHRDLGEPVTVTYREGPDSAVALRVED